MDNEKIIAAKVLFKDNIASIPDMVQEWKEFGINHAFTLEDLFVNPEYQREINKSNIKTWVIIQTLLNTSRKDSLYAIKSDGSKAIGTGEGRWLHMICPNGGPDYSESDNYISNLIEHLRNLVSSYNPYGLNLDFIRYFVFWEDVYENTDPSTLPQTCFCNRCVDLFSKKINEILPEDLISTADKSDWILKNFQNEWIEFKTETISNIVKRIVDSVKEIKPEIKFNIHAVPWLQNEFNGAIKRVAGQDFKALGEIVDGISPMCYTYMLKRDSRWINNLVDDIRNQTTIPVLPAFQGVEMYNSGTISKDSFVSCIKESLKRPSAGIAFWPWESISEEHKDLIRGIKGAYS